MRRKSQLVRRVVGLALSGTAMLGLTTEAWSQVSEIIVTTRKREENLQDVPIAVQALTAVDLERKGITSIDGVIEQSASLILDQGISKQDLRVVVRGLSPTRGRQNVAILQDGIDISSESIGTSGGSLLINPRLFDLERVEVVKGPQNALFGRSAFAGAINYITRKPGDSFEAKVGLDVGSAGQAEFSGMVMGPVTESVSLGLTGQIWSHDGYYDNAFTGHELGGAEGTSMAGTAVWKPAEAVQVTARIENLNDEFDVSPFAIMPFNTSYTLPPEATEDPPGDAGPVVNPANPFIGSIPGVRGDAPDASELRAQNGENPRTCDPAIPVTDQIGCQDYDGSDRDITRGTLTIEWDTGPVAITSLTHLADANIVNAEGAREASASLESRGVGEFTWETDVSLFSQELRGQGSVGEAFTWTVGGLYWKEEVDQLDGAFSCLLADLPATPEVETCSLTMAEIGLTVPLNADTWIRDTEHYSIYTLLEYRFAGMFTVAGEARWVTEESDVKGPNVNNTVYFPSFGQTGPSPAPTALIGGTVDDDFLPWKVTLSALPSEGQLYYFSVAEAYKPKGISTLTSGGGFNPDLAQFDQERLLAYELGAKTDWRDGTLRLNGSVFFYDFKNKQVSTQYLPPGGTFLIGRVINAGAAEVLGAELDATWQPTENVTLGLAYTWLDTEYTDYRVGTTSAGNIATIGNCTISGEVPSSCIVDLSGNELEGAPENALVANARYQDGLTGDMDWFVEGDAQFTDDRFASDKNRLVLPAYWLFNLRAGISGDVWDAVVYLDNAFDDDTVRTGIEENDVLYTVDTLQPPVSNGISSYHGSLILPDERQWGLRVNFRFGAD